MDLPFLTSSTDSIGGSLRASPEDFRVEEIPAYAPSGAGEHLYVTFEKRDLTTPEAVKRIARALEVDARDCGWAGLKDRHAVTVQTASFPRADLERARALELPGIRVLAAARHNNKLRTGHLHGNRFAVRVRGCVSDAPALAATVRERLLAVGVPNYFGVQRFGREGDNASRARAWLTGETKPPRDRFERKMLVSALQSALFNRYVAERLTDGLLDRYVTGDLAVRHPVGGPFLIDATEAPELYAAKRASATGPMFGPSMRWPEAEARTREEKLPAAEALTVEHFARARELGEGTRRSVRIVLDSLEIEVEPSNGGRHDLLLRFALPAGGYATSVLREFRKTDDETSSPEPDAREG